MLGKGYGDLPPADLPPSGGEDILQVIRPVKVEFQIKNNEQQKVKGLPLFHITGEDNVLVNIADKKEITYSKNLNNKIVAVLPDHRVAVLGTSEFLKAVQAKNNSGVVVFELKEIDKNIKSLGDLNEIISQL